MIIRLIMWLAYKFKFINNFVNQISIAHLPTEEQIIDHCQQDLKKAVELEKTYKLHHKGKKQ